MIFYYIDVGDTYTTHLPTNLAQGDYLIRHEIIALQLAQSVGGAEFYPSCSQLRVSSSSTTGTPDSSFTTKFPGGYSDTDPGIFVPTVYNPGANYTSFPGPNVDSRLASDLVAITAPVPTSSANGNGAKRRRLRFARDLDLDFDLEKKWMVIELD